MLVVPDQGARMRTLVNVLWRADLLAVKGVVVLPVIKLLPDAPADLEVMLGRYRHVTGVEQTVDVATKEEAVLRLMVTAFTVGSDVRGLQGRQCPLAGDRAAPIVNVCHQNAECTLSE